VKHPPQFTDADYTYVGQFIDHDITFDPTSLPESAVDPLSLNNFRTPLLELDSFYGAGPAVQPHNRARFLCGARTTRCR
jgi:hypothetical protein